MQGRKLSKALAEGVACARTSAGGAMALAEALGVSHQAVCKWKKIPAERVPAICAKFGCKPEQLRPDLYCEATRSTP